MKMKTTKITVKVWKPLLADFDAQLDRLCIKRDAFLNHMLSVEVRQLRSDLHGKCNSPRARRYISSALKRMGTHTVNVVVDKSVAKALADAVKAHNLVRDAFVNTMIMYLRSSDSLLKYLDLPRFVMRGEFERYIYDELPTSPLRAIEAFYADPLQYIRLGAEERYEEGLYAVALPPKLIGFTCHLADDHVPGTPAHAEMQRDTTRMLRELEALEDEAFATPKRKGEGK
jgi:hypothetical protein